MASPRLSVSFDQRSAERLERLAKDDQGKAEVIREALALEDLYREATSKGGRLMVERPDGSVAEIVRPSGPWGSTGNTTPASGGYTLPPGTNGDRDRRELLARVIAVLYSCISSAQQAPNAESENEHAVQQLVIANVALAIGELEAFLTLVVAGIEGPSCIHLRAIGELTIRVVLCREHRDLALKIYRSWGPSWTILAHKHTPFVKSYLELQNGEKNMQEIERSEEFKSKKKAIAERDHLLSDAEWSMWSKRTHGDIYALVQVSVNLAQRGSDIRSPIIREVPFGIMANVLLQRATAFAIMLMKHIHEAFGIVIPAQTVKAIMENFEEIQERDEARRSLEQKERKIMLDRTEDFIERFKPFKGKIDLQQSSYQTRNEDGAPGGWIAQVQVWEDHSNESIVTPFWPTGSKRYDSIEQANSAALWGALKWLEEGRPTVQMAGEQPPPIEPPQSS